MGRKPNMGCYNYILIPLCLPPAHSLVAGAASPLWHQRLGHPSLEALSKLV
jgi:hypothetical protein